MEQGENMEKEKKEVKEAVISGYEKNIYTTLKSELSNLESANTFDSKKDASTLQSITSILFLSITYSLHAC